MKDYNFEIDKLLKKYNLFEEFSDVTIGEKLKNIFYENVKNDKKYILFYDDFTRNIVYNCELEYSGIKKYNLKGFIFQDREILNVKNDISNIDEYDIIIFSYYLDEELLKNMQGIFKNNAIINILEFVPDYMKSKVQWEKYCILRRIEFKETCLKVNLFCEFLEEQKKIIKNKHKEELKVIIWGGGYHTRCLLANTDIINKFEIKYIVDSNKNLSGNYINGIEVISKDKLSTIDYNTFIISSFEHEEEIREEIEREYSGKEYICLYDNENNWGQLFNIKLNKINQSKDFESCIELIKLYLCIRDFKNAEKYIYDYINKEYKQHEKMKKFLVELNSLLEELKKVILTKKQSNIQFMIVDSLDKSGKDKYMRFINKLGKENIEFQNAFSASTYTTESHLCMFNEKYLFEDNNFIRKQITIADCQFAKKLKQKGYRFACNDSTHIVDKLFDDKIDKSDESTPISKILWDNLCYVITNIEKTIFLYSRFMEFHDSWTASMYSYIDSQLEYYSNFFSKNDYIIILADHGYGYEYEKRTHIPLIISTPENKNLKIDCLFSTKNIGHLILDLVENKFNGVEKSKYIKVERTPIYNNVLVDMFKIRNQKKLIQAYRIIRTVDEIYVLFEDGTEEYYRVPNDKTNLINESKYETEINKFREINKNDKFPNFKLDKEHYS